MKIEGLGFSAARRDGLLLLGFCGFLFFFGLAHFGLIGADEPRYAQVAREMLERHDWITPTLGGQPWLEKPVLYYWQAMLAYRAFGVSDWAARLPSALNATVLVLAVYFFLRRFRPGFALDGALITAAAAGILGFARAASMDMGLAASFTLALLAWFAWQEAGKQGYLAVFYFGMALGTLAKGPVAPFLAVAVIGLFVAAKGEWRLLWRMLWFPGILLFIAVTAPWYVLVQWHNPQFFRVFILEHNLARFGTPVYHHTAPFWYYVPVVLVALLPWAVFVIAAIVEVARAWWQEKRELLRSEDSFSVFLLLWLLAPVAFFSISQSKLPGYIIPALPAGTLLLTEYVRRHAEDGEATRPSPWLVVPHALLASSLLVPAVTIQYLVLQNRMPWGMVTWVAGALALLLALGITITLRGRLGLRALRFVTLVPVVLTVAAILKIGTPALEAKLSSRPVAEEIQRTENGHLPVAVFGVQRETEYGLHFYRNHVILRYELAGAPAEDHILVVPARQLKEAAKFVDGRKIAHLGSFPAQGLEYFWIGPPEPPGSR